MKSIITLSFILVSLISSAQSEIEAIKNKGSIVLGTSGSQAPFTFHDEKDSLVGIDIEIAKALAFAMEVKLEIKELPFDQLLDALESKEVDIVISGLTMRAIRNMEFAMAGPYHNCKKAFLTKDKSLFPDATVLNSKGMKFAALQNSTSMEDVSIFYPKAELVPCKTMDACVELLKKNEVAGVLGDYENLYAYKASEHDLHLKFIEDLLLVDPLGIAIRPDDYLFINLIENFIHTAQNSGYLEILEKRYDVHEKK